MQIISQTDENCDCAESRYVGKSGAVVLTRLRVHNCQYARQRRALIPTASAYADALVSTEDRGKRTWSQIFHKRSDELMRESETEAATNAEMPN